MAYNEYLNYPQGGRQPITQYSPPQNQNAFDFANAFGKNSNYPNSQQFGANGQANNPNLQYGYEDSDLGTDFMDFDNQQSGSGNLGFGVDSLDNSMNPQEFNNLYDHSMDNTDKMGWDKGDWGTAIQGVGTLANIGFGIENLSMAEKNLKMKKEQHQGWLDDRKTRDADKAKLQAIRF